MEAIEQSHPSPIGVLYVDDEPKFSELVELKLEQIDERLSLVTETRAKDGLTVLEETSIDCIISDYQMPRMDGLAFLDAVRSEYPSLPFILYTGNGSEDVAAEAINAGVDAYVQKYSGNDQYSILAKHVDTLVAKHRAEQRLECIERATHLAPFDDCDPEADTPHHEEHSPSLKIVREIADREDVDPVNLKPPLYEAIDPEVLDPLVSSVKSRGTESSVSISFEYNGYCVTIDGSEMSLEAVGDC